MRPILLGDLDAAVRAVLVVPPSERRSRIARIIERAERADRYLGATGRFHPEDGNGSLGSAARSSMLIPAGTRCDRAYLLALEVVVLALIERHEEEIGRLP